MKDFISKIFAAITGFMVIFVVVVLAGDFIYLQPAGPPTGGTVESYALGRVYTTGTSAGDSSGMDFYTTAYEIDFDPASLMGWFEWEWADSAGQDSLYDSMAVILYTANKIGDANYQLALQGDTLASVGRVHYALTNTNDTLFKRWVYWRIHYWIWDSCGSQDTLALDYYIDYNNRINAR